MKISKFANIIAICFCILLINQFAYCPGHLVDIDRQKLFRQRREPRRGLLGYMPGRLEI
jgi:hypothetical protein